MQKRGCCVAECRTKEFLIYHPFRYSPTKDAMYVFFSNIFQKFWLIGHIIRINCGIFSVFLMAFSALIFSVCHPSPWFCINQPFFLITKNKFFRYFKEMSVWVKVIHPKYYKHLKKGTHQSHLGRQKWAGFWQISL